MKHASAKSTIDMLHKIETIEKEVMDLKLSVLKKLAPPHSPDKSGAAVSPADKS